jgi:hypothetical protein
LRSSRVPISNRVGTHSFFSIQFDIEAAIFDLPWNPMAIEQRRIGQQREVFVFNLVIRGTLEEQILHLLDEKARCSSW